MSAMEKIFGMFGRTAAPAPAVSNNLQGTPPFRQLQEVALCLLPPCGCSRSCIPARTTQEPLATS